MTASQISSSWVHISRELLCDANQVILSLKTSGFSIFSHKVMGAHDMRTSHTAQHSLAAASQWMHTTREQAIQPNTLWRPLLNGCTQRENKPYSPRLFRSCFSMGAHNVKTSHTAQHSFAAASQWMHTTREQAVQPNALWRLPPGICSIGILFLLLIPIHQVVCHADQRLRPVIVYSQSGILLSIPRAACRPDQADEHPIILCGLIVQALYVSIPYYFLLINDCNDPIGDFVQILLDPPDPILHLIGCKSPL